MKKYIPWIVWGVAAVGLITSICMLFFTQGQATAVSQTLAPAKQIADGIAEGINTDMQTGFQLAFETSTMGYYLVMFVITCLSVVLIALAKFVPACKKCATVFYSVAAAFALVCVGLLINNLSVMNYNYDNLTSMIPLLEMSKGLPIGTFATMGLTKAADIVTFSGTAALFVGIVAQLLVFAACIYLIIRSVRNKQAD